MREYDENHAYEEVREDFIKEYKAQLERRGNGETLEMVAEGTPFESFTFKGNRPLLCTSISMELVYRNCYIFAIREIDEAVSDILEIQDEAEWISPERLEQLEHVIVFPVNLSHCRNKLEENGVAYLPFEDMAVTFQFCIEDDKRSYRRDVTREWLDRQGLNAEELFEIVRYKNLEQIWGEIKNIEQLGKKSEESQQAVLYGINGFGAAFYPKVMEQVVKKMGSEVLIIPEESYTADIQTQDIKSAAKLQEELQEDNRVKMLTGDRHLVLSGKIFKYDADRKNLVPAMEHFIEKHKVK
ncbi:TPA: hypothetical protein KNN56_001717 [Clostridioides difficile]|uniref:hypothetical protein n=1 Tax=Clostridioides difficile TaxID=1496 RepID=UPI00038D2ABC|nr:hypothetical protein [Clostridioides difficile]EGT4625304.1 hypothetical protein [Clostridioides difficile]ELX4576096.1 hypothetical protein [Clostridioides difficile]EQK76167.1 hypothetical protein QEE_1744 [Clostridioides difficile CD113]MBH6986692.1 hypothetical protein [Clostridioides difficile]MBH7139388.1 hypothetical protein [Clostridioides difficile]